MEDNYIKIRELVCGLLIRHFYGYAFLDYAYKILVMVIYLNVPKGECFFLYFFFFSKSRIKHILLSYIISDIFLPLSLPEFTRHLDNFMVFSFDPKI